MFAKGQAAHAQVTAQRAIEQTLTHAESTLEKSRSALQREALTYVHEQEIISQRQMLATEAQAELLVSGAQSEAREYASQAHAVAEARVAENERQLAHHADALSSQASARIAAHEQESLALRHQLLQLEATLAARAVESERLLNERNSMATEMSAFQAHPSAGPAHVDPPLEQPAPVRVEEAQQTFVEPFSPVNTTESLFVGLSPVSYTHLTLPTKRIV